MPEERRKNDERICRLERTIYGEKLGDVVVVEGTYSKCETMFKSYIFTARIYKTIMYFVGVLFVGVIGIGLNMIFGG